jgi:branched-chain amino acid transport system substrate-binding protein
MTYVRERAGRIWLRAGFGLLAAAAVSTAILASAASGRVTATPIKIAILSDCQGPFGNQYNADIGGAEAAFAQFAGAHLNNPADPSKGFSGGAVNGHPLQLVGIGCSDSTPDKAIKEVKRLMEQLHADILIGPLSGDEGVATANYAKAHPSQTFINGTSGAQDTTLKVQAPNFFRFNGDGAMWNAGIGDLAYHKLHWRKAAIIMDDYSFAWTSAAGMITDFCAVGGQIVKRVFPPLGTTDYSSFVRQLPPPNKVDGYFWVVGGTGTIASLKAFESAYGPLKASQFVGNLFFGVPGNSQSIAPRINCPYTGGFGTPGLDYQTPATKAYVAAVSKAVTAVPPLGAMNIGNAYNGFFFNYYKDGWALVNALKADGGDPSSKALDPALAKVVLNTPFGVVKLDKNRQAIEGEWSYQLSASSKGTTVNTSQFIPNVDQTFSGTYSAKTPAPGRSFPTCAKRSLSWIGKEKPVVNGKITG